MKISLVIVAAAIVVAAAYNTFFMTVDSVKLYKMEIICCYEKSIKYIYNKHEREIEELFVSRLVWCIQNGCIKYPIMQSTFFLLLLSVLCHCLQAVPLKIWLHFIQKMLDRML